MIPSGHSDLFGDRRGQRLGDWLVARALSINGSCRG